MKMMKEDFDSEILGLEVFKIIFDGKTPENLKKAVQKIRTGIIFCFTPLINQNITILENLGFHFISIRNTYKFSGPSVGESSEDYLIEPFAPGDPILESEIFNLAQTIYRESRYYKDDDIPKDKSIEIYTHWIKNSLFNGYVQKCFLARHQDKPIGICTVKIKDREGFIDLLGVLPEHQDKKIGKQLLMKGLDYLKSNNVDSTFVVTEGENIKANIFYQKNGFIIHSVDLVYHKHI